LRIIADEMVSPKIVRTISDTVLTSGWLFESVITAKLRGRPDEDWIMAFARSGGNVFVSADQKMLKREALLSGISETGLIGIYLPSAWAGQRRDETRRAVGPLHPLVDQNRSYNSGGYLWIGVGGAQGTWNWRIAATQGDAKWKNPKN